ncbi:hypothetical protein DFP73DRAFT_556158 [Morchella snyderi]|nr:hypothetical protein DFP73DRAFT_556158 [Morchella snyderi]
MATASFLLSFFPSFLSTRLSADLGGAIEIRSIANQCAVCYLYLSLSLSLCRLCALPCCIQLPKTVGENMQPDHCPFAPSSCIACMHSAPRGRVE